MNSTLLIVAAVVSWYTFACLMMRYKFSLDAGLDGPGVRLFVVVASPILYPIVFALSVGDWFLNVFLVSPRLRRKE